MLVLGLSGGVDAAYEYKYEFPAGFAHDAATVLLRDGEVVAAIEEERINRIKHCNKNWRYGVEFCLQQAGASLEEVDAIAFYASKEWLRNFLGIYYLAKPDAVDLKEPAAFLAGIFEKEFGVQVPEEKFQFVNHHTAHTVSTFVMSGFDDSLIVTIDGVGEGVSMMVSTGKGKQIETLHTEPEVNSLGGFYRLTIQFLGYKMFDEYKVMGLAPYGNADRFRALFQSFYTLLPDGRYQVHQDRVYNLYSILKPRRKHEPFEQIHQDLSAALQEALETIVFHILKHYRETTGLSRLCMAGGVAQNSSMNGKIALSGIFDDVFIQPASHDAGCALGSALAIAHTTKPELPNKRLKHVYWGTPTWDNSRIAEAFKPWEQWIDFHKLSSTCLETAQMLADGAKIGWVQGRSEFGPRALGNRSIIADPRPAENKDIINSMIKMRESYRPFAPSLIEEKVEEYFEVPEGQKQFPFMASVLKVREQHRETLGAITHVDGSARLQTVSRDTNPRYWELIHAFGEITGTYMLINTSFNNNAEPIVDTPIDALVCFLTSGLNALVVGDYVVRKKPFSLELLDAMTLDIPLALEMNEHTRFVDYRTRETDFLLEWNYKHGTPSKISQAAYQILKASAPGLSLAQLATQTGSDLDDTLRQEILDLWHERKVIVSPA